MYEETNQSFCPNPVVFFVTQIMCHKKKMRPGSCGPSGGSLSMHLPVLTQIEMVFYENCFGVSLTTYSSVF